MKKSIQPAQSINQKKVDPLPFRENKAVPKQPVKTL
jgi:hypothetical protein